ncbi:Serine/threonine-protein phosphatase [Spironucleus salmonicida]|uniref:Serine/threonine-protein phosphatase n=1 Tax=Spironucleus salmonicida TaxID=348837 RepID=V6LMA4_9EUKA|nr:Serine/threonine-protein phosphatase [Spironucleus salmonicida]|eukprot:EST41844.1 Serine/threonine-protein phosphatase [Spironucleus salmonicida]
MAIDLDLFIERVFDGQMLSEEEVDQICKLGQTLLDQEPNVIQVQAPVTIVGDIHGQFHDLIEMFRICGRPPYTNYLFLGDYVDRGYYSVECAILVVLLKLRYPNRITLIRGNHESRQVTQVYGFYDEVLRKYRSQTVWKSFTALFDVLPVAAVVSDKVFCIHAGLSPGFETISELNELFRKQEIPHDGPLADILWSDPDVRQGWGRSPRGAGYIFGADVTEKFLKRNDLKLVARGHQMAMDGYQWNHDKQIVTIFGAPNYCYRSGNQGAVMEIDENCGYGFIQYKYAPRRGDPSAHWVPEYFL